MCYVRCTSIYLPTYVTFLCHQYRNGRSELFLVRLWCGMKICDSVDMLEKFLLSVKACSLRLVEKESVQAVPILQENVETDLKMWMKWPTA